MNHISTTTRNVTPGDIEFARQRVQRAKDNARREQRAVANVQIGLDRAYEANRSAYTRDALRRDLRDAQRRYEACVTEQKLAEDELTRLLNARGDSSNGSSATATTDRPIGRTELINELAYLAQRLDRAKERLDALEKKQ
jgi:hypothetical protein